MSQPTPEQIVAAAEEAKALGLTEDEVVTTPYKGDENKGISLDWAVEKYKHEQLVSIIFDKEDDEGFNVFIVTYNKKSKAD
jgi:hypothetical protein